MMKHIVLAAAVALALTGPAALAQESQEPQEEPAREKKICRTDRMTGENQRLRPGVGRVSSHQAGACGVRQPVSDG